MEYNLAGIRKRVVVDKLDDEEFDPDIVDNFINDTQRNIFNQYELSFQEKIFSGTVPAGVTMFKFPDDVALVQSQVITAPDGTQKNLKNTYIPFREFNTKFPTQDGTPGAVGYWTSFAGNMILSTPTDQEYTMNIFYISKPKTLTQNSDVPQIPEEFAELLVLGAYMRILSRNEDTDLKTGVEAEYNQLLNMLVNRYGFRQADGPIKMKNQQR